MQIKKFQKWQAQWPCGRTLLLGSAILLLLVGVAELLLRQHFIQARLPIPSIGSNNRSLELKVHLLQQMVERRGPPDCIFLGSSQVTFDIDPEVFGQSYRAATGKPIRSFNFGVNALTLFPAVKLLHILLKRYHPGMIVWGITPADLQDRDRNKPTGLENNAWIRYQSGESDFGGRLTDISYLYRYYLRFRYWLDFPQISRNQNLQEKKTTAYGYRKNLSRKLADVQGRAEQAAGNLRMSREFNTDPFVLAVLKTALALDPGTAIVLVEMPLHPSRLPTGRAAADKHDQAIAKLQATAGRSSKLFIPVNACKTFAAGEWADYIHLNQDGSRQFSLWLGARIGAAVKSSLLPDPRRGGN